MKPLIKNVLISTVSASIGGIIVLAAIKMSPEFRAKIDNPKSPAPVARDSMVDDILEQQQGIRKKFDSFFDDDFFSGSDPFADMKKLREQMDKRMEKFGIEPHSMSNPFDSWFSNKFGGGTVSDISKREDDQFVYYDIKVEDLKSTSVNTKIENGYITITGSIEKKDASGDDNGDTSSQSLFRSTFKRTFPLPENVDGNKMEMVPDDNKITLKFPKLMNT